MYFLYSVLALVFLIGLSPWFLYQAVRYRKYVGSLSERMGNLPVSFNMDGEPSIWIHAVSVGEVLTARPLARDLRARYPRLRILLSTTTLGGHAMARRHLQDVDGLFYFPFDFGIFVRRTLDLVRPRLFVMMETEIWPNLLRECRRRGIKTAVVNGRLSKRSFARYKFIRGAMQRILDDVDAFCVQSEESARRFIDLGANPGRVTVTGSLKFDSLDVPAAALVQPRARDRVLRFFRIPASRPVFIAGSTMKGEDQLVLAAFRRIRATVPSTLLILAPRHLERASDVAEMSRQEGFKTVRRSELPIDAEPRADVVILDSIGELATLYQTGNGRLRRREPRRHGRAQHSRTGSVRQADCFRSAHGQLRRDLGGVSDQRRRRAGEGSARARGSARLAHDGSDSPRASRRRRARAGRSQSRRQGQIARGARGAPPARSVHHLPLERQAI